MVVVEIVAAAVVGHRKGLVEQVSRLVDWEFESNNLYKNDVCAFKNNEAVNLSHYDF